MKVAVCGASGGIGQPLSLLLKQSPLVTQLSLYDIVHTPGVAADLSHIDTPARVQGFNGPENLDKALKGQLIYVRCFVYIRYHCCYQFDSAYKAHLTKPYTITKVIVVKNKFLASTQL